MTTSSLSEVFRRAGPYGGTCGERRPTHSRVKYNEQSISTPACACCFPLHRMARRLAGVGREDRSHMASRPPPEIRIPGTGIEP